jgi:8-oxo-dGTP pyrophosphatase MutT (NUDIX family)
MISAPDTLHPAPGTVVQAGGIIAWRQWIVLRRTLLGEWVFPKGWIDPGETPEQTAVREVREETGLRAEILEFAGIQAYEADGEERNVAYYLMRVLDSPEWSDHGGHDAGLFLPRDVAATLTFENNRTLWAKVADDVQRIVKNPRPERGR